MAADMPQKNYLIERLCVEARILPVITFGSEAQILPLADALAAGGIRTLEVTLRSQHGLTAIRRLRQERPELCVGAGTVLDERMLEQCVEAGAQFLVSPGVTPALLEAGAKCPVPLLPGTANASDIMLGLALGYTRFKLFPAEVCGGVAALQALAGPFPQVRFCPTGGVNAGNAARYIQQPNVMCVGGTWMIAGQALKDGDWVAIEQASREAMAALGG